MADDDAKVAARWLGIWRPGTECYGASPAIKLDACPRCGSREVEWCGGYLEGQTFTLSKHDIPPPDFADPAVYDRALRELACRFYYPRLENYGGRYENDPPNYWALFVCLPLDASIRAMREVGRGPTIGAAIAAAIAELARAEGTNDADMGPQNRKPDERA